MAGALYTLGYNSHIPKVPGTPYNRSRMASCDWQEVSRDRAYLSEEGTVEGDSVEAVDRAHVDV